MTATAGADAHAVADRLARMGYVVRGLLYVLMGFFAFRLTFGAHPDPADQQGAIAAIGRQPAGRLWLVAVLAGLLCYALWGVFRAVADRHHQGRDFQGIVARLGYLVSAVAYASFAFAAYRLIVSGRESAPGRAQEAETRHLVASIMSLPLGRWLVGALGVFVIGVGGYQIYQGVRVAFDRHLTSSLPERPLRWIRRMGRFGTVVRGALFGLVGTFMVLSAYRSDPSEARGVDASLMMLLHQPYGRWILGFLSVGLLAFGLYSFTTGVWFRVKK